jgi:hypothetical protein
MQSETEMQRQADMVANHGLPIQKKIPLIEKDKKSWDSADQHYIKSDAVEGESEGDRTMRLQSESMMAAAIKKKKPLIQKDSKRWDSADQHNIQNNLLQM